MFPLPLTCFEEYMLCDDRPAYPMSIVGRMRLTGFLEPAAFEAALAATVQRHVFLRATVKRIPGRRPVWIDHPDWRPAVQWQVNVNPSGFPSMTHLDVTREPGIRCWVLARNDGHDVIIQAHHCCMDGAGVIMMAEELLVGYALNVGAVGGNVSLPSLDSHRLLQRVTPKLTTGKFLKTAHKQLLGLIGVRDFFLRRPVPLMAGAYSAGEAATTSEMFPAIHIYEFDPDDTKKISAAAKRLRVTMNMLLIRDLFVTLGTWREQHANGTDEDRLRLSIPVNLRGPADKQMPICNAVSMIFLDRRGRGRAYPDLLLKGIYEQLWLIKRFQLQYTYILSIGAAQLLPGMMSRITRADNCYATSYFSNLGVLGEQTSLPRREGRVVSGNVVLESVDAVSVLRPHTNVGFLAYIYSGRLRISMQYDSRVISAEQSSELLDMYGRQIRNSMDFG